MNNQTKLFFATFFVLLHQVYLYVQIPPLIDEVYSWLFFGGRSIWISITDYSYVNNHILYNICTNIARLFIPEETLSMRFFSLLSFWVLLFYVYYFLQKKSGERTALTAFLFVGLGFSQSVFSVQGRGYMPMALCSFGAFVSLWEILSGSKKHFYYFLLWNIAGFFLSPAFLYFSLGIYAFCLYEASFSSSSRKHKPKSKKKLLAWWFVSSQTTLQKQVIFSGILVILGTLLAYSPTFYFFGFAKFLAAHKENFKPDTFLHFATYTFPICAKESILYLFALPKYASFLCFLAFISCSYYFYKYLSDAGKFMLRYLAVSCLTVLVFILCTRTFPFYRVWTYYAIFLALASAFLVGELLPITRYTKFWIALPTLVVASYFQIHFALPTFYDKDTVLHCTQLRDKFLHIAQKNQPIFLDENAFYGILWLRKAGKEHLLVNTPCDAHISVLAVDKTSPACLQKQEDIWFLRFYIKK